MSSNVLQIARERVKYSQLDEIYFLICSRGCAVWVIVGSWDDGWLQEVSVRVDIKIKTPAAKPPYKTPVNELGQRMIGRASSIVAIEAVRFNRNSPENDDRASFKRSSEFRSCRAGVYEELLFGLCLSSVCGENRIVTRYRIL